MALCTMLASEAESLRRIHLKTFNFPSSMLELFSFTLLGNTHYLKSTKYH